MTVIKFPPPTSGRLSRAVDTRLNLDKLIAAHRATRAIRLAMDAADVPDGPDYDAAQDAEEAAMRALIAATCTPDQVIVKRAYIFSCDKADASGPPCQGDDYGPVALAVQAFFKQRAA
jgi:hypothetical protein